MNFTYDAYRELIETAKEKFEIRPLGDAYRPIGQKPVLLLRHDVDVSVEKALVLACIELNLAVRSAYMVMVDCPLYGPIGESEGILNRLAWLGLFGREVGLHVVVNDNQGRLTPPEIEERVLDGTKILTDYVCPEGQKVEAVSFHAPDRVTVEKHIWQERISGLVNAYNAMLTGLYITDSGGRWRAGSLVQHLGGYARQDVDPLVELMSTKENRVQLLVHPVWWGDVQMEPAQRLSAVRSWLIDSGRLLEDVDSGFAQMMPRLWGSQGKARHGKTGCGAAGPDKAWLGKAGSFSDSDERRHCCHVTRRSARPG